MEKMIAVRVVCKNNTNPKLLWSHIVAPLSQWTFFRVFDDKRIIAHHIGMESNFVIRSDVELVWKDLMAFLNSTDSVFYFDINEADLVKDINETNPS